MTYHVFVFVHIKIDATPIFGVSRINAIFVVLFQRAEIGLASNFLCSHTNKRYEIQLYNKILAYLRNMGAKRPLFRICHPDPCVRKKHPKMGYVLRGHGFGWQIRNTGSSAPILHQQSCIGGPVGRGYSLLVQNTIKKFSNPIYIFKK